MPTTRSATTRSFAPTDGANAMSVGAAIRSGAGTTARASITNVERVAGLDDRPARRAVGVREVRRNVELPLTTDLDPDETLFPPVDDPSLAERERVRDAAVVAAVELDAIGGAHPDVVDEQRVADRRRVPGAASQVGHHQRGRDRRRYGDGRLRRARDRGRRLPRDQIDVVDRRAVDARRGALVGLARVVAARSEQKCDRDDDGESEGAAHACDATGGRSPPPRERRERRLSRSHAGASVRTGRRG